MLFSHVEHVMGFATGIKLLLTLFALKLSRTFAPCETRYFLIANIASKRDA
jgi:hypothetical protein